MDMNRPSHTGFFAFNTLSMYILYVYIGTIGSHTAFTHQPIGMYVHTLSRILTGKS